MNEDISKQKHIKCILQPEPNSVWTVSFSRFGMAPLDLFLYQLAPLKDDQQPPLLEAFHTTTLSTMSA